MLPIYDALVLKAALVLLAPFGWTLAQLDAGTARVE